MKKQITLLTALMIFIAISINATVWRVNNRVNVDADFTTLAAAISGASANDTIYLEGSPTSYGAGTFQKTLTVIGTGYFLNENDSTQAYKEKSIVGLLSFYNGGQGSVVEGLTISVSGSWGATAVIIGTNDITLRRNYIYTNIVYSGLSYAITINSVYNSIIIEQNWIRPRAKTVNDAYAIFFSSYTINSIIRNNIFYCDTTNHAIFMTTDHEASSLIITNNVIRGDIATYHSSQYNNIIISGTYTAGTDDLSSNNICDATQYPAINGNQQNVDMATVFVDHLGVSDNGYILKAGSPAIGAGVLGVDCGAFGTNDPYMLSGMPPIPAIFDFEMSQTIGTSTIPVTIKSMSHK